MPATKPKIRDDVTLLEIGEEAVAYDPLSRLVHYMNPMASLVLQLCDGTATVRETIAELAEAQEVEPAAITPQVRSLVRQFREFGLVAPSRGAERLLAQTDSSADDRAKIRREVPRSE
jgi:PqqD family protein of HPr-rel-A system